jgi:hypothetical protein
MSEDPIEESLEDAGPVLPQEDDGELVHWMEKKPLSLGPPGVSAAVLGGFALGVAATLVALALADVVDPMVVVRRRRGVSSAG